MLGGQPGEQVGSEPHQEGLSKGRELCRAGPFFGVAQAGASRHASRIIATKVFRILFKPITSWHPSWN